LVTLAQSIDERYAALAAAEQPRSAVEAQRAVTDASKAVAEAQNAAARERQRRERLQAELKAEVAKHAATRQAMMQRDTRCAAATEHSTGPSCVSVIGLVPTLRVMVS
jgi:hypothetical protein